MSKYVLALDLGTTGNKAIVFDKQGNTIASEYSEFPQIFPKEGWVEHNPNDIWETALKVIAIVIEKVGAENIQAIGITNQRETTIIWDKKTGKPLYNAIVWQCRRTENICKHFSQLKKLIKEKTGLFLDPYFSATKIKWLIDNVEDVNKKVKSKDALFGTVDSWILYNLTAGKCHATDITNASRTMIFNIKTLEYDEELLNLFEIPRHLLPQVFPSNHLFGYTDKKLFGKEIPIAGIIGDQQASLFAHGGWRNGLIKNTYGTGLFMMTSTKNKIYYSDNLISTIAWQIDKDVEYALEGSIFVGGSLIQWLRDGLGIINDTKEVEDLAKKVNSSENVVFVPALTGLGAPYWDPSARGLIIGITRGTTKEHIARAALEGIAFQTRDVFEEFVKTTKNEIDFSTLAVDGGASKNNFLMQFQADILGIDIERPYITESTALGAAAMAAISTGFWDKNNILKIREIEKEFKPKMDNKTRKKIYNKWLNALQRSLNWAKD
ncbi:glycerol kinase GlpK [Deferribacter autotrophicus]|uniref:Glycerol kinase n=1 Tax=Deferribacter autotrophicus TaxID=500465 RepID=A0A5A8F5E6_9BACT|nr:glycerol kinase GlpK [Deferribacter autotrophicus]KAA0259364.1 glycerol kinase GlpK [Deferribacter autotrophicus]